MELSFFADHSMTDDMCITQNFARKTRMRDGIECLRQAHLEGEINSGSNSSNSPIGYDSQSEEDNK